MRYNFDKKKHKKSKKHDSNSKTNNSNSSKSKGLKYYWLKIKQFWDYVWNGDDFLSLVLSLIFAFIIIKFIFYPGLSLVLGTTHPVVAIVSGSMEHKVVVSNKFPEICGSYQEETAKLNLDEYWSFCGPWYEDNVDISKEKFKDFDFKNGMNIGDVVVLTRANPNKLEVGDVIVFIQKENPRKEPIIHRIVKIENTSSGIKIQTKGDHNRDSINVSTRTEYIDEYDITEENLVGKALIRVPYVGYVKILAYDLYIWLINLF